ncbi:MAG: hypothetical protein K8I27_13720 [Planctomycetes bacterium]|nr:hypothetical protein [Planctomycetota bacterium]
MKHLNWAIMPALVALAIISASCAKDNGKGGGGGGGGASCELSATIPNFAAAVFSNPTTINNTYLPFTPGVTNIYRAETEDGLETIVVETLNTTRVVNGVTCVVVRDTVYLDDLVIEDTYDWYAQDDAGNVWYMGEEVTNYEYDDDDNLIGTNTGGSWEAGLDILSTGSPAIAGIIMPGTPVVNDTYYLEYYLTEAEDLMRIEALNVPIILADGRTFNCLQVLECNPLEEDTHEYKFYAPGIGIVREESIADGEFVEHRATYTIGPAGVPNYGAAVFSNPTTINNPMFPLMPGTSWNYVADTEDGTELIVVDVLASTRVVDGVLCTEVRDRVYLDGRLIEDTLDWYAQDDAGNVWYMGEIVVNYVYDEVTGLLLSTNNGGSWETNVMGALPGYQMPAVPTAGASYHQEYWAGEATDAGFVLRTDASVILTNNNSYTNCLQTVDWNPLDPTGLEYKFYAAGVGMIMEVEVDGEEVVELTIMTP